MSAAAHASGARTLFVGGGNMAGALIGGLVAQGADPGELAAVDPSPEARERLEREHRVRAAPAPDPSWLGRSTLVVLAVKPQHMREAARAVGPLLSSQVVLSIAAGIRLGDLSRWLGGYRRLVRAMPNTPALVRGGIAGLYALPEVTPDERAQADAILRAVGETFWCAEERMIDAVTAVSGSGPAYVFYFIEGVEQAARELGFAPEQARALALATFAGAAALARSSGEEPATLRARVTSKGGTTERAVAVLEAAAVKTRIVEAVLAADARARELGAELGRG